MTVQSSTILLNHADEIGGGIANVGGVMTVKNVIMSSNGVGNCSGNPLTPEGVNLVVFDESCPGFTVVDDLLLGPLANNGGPTMTHALLPGSPAIDAAVDCTLVNGVTPVNTDQRGVTRPWGAACDVGAFELEQGAAPPPLAIPVTATVRDFMATHPDFDGDRVSPEKGLVENSLPADHKPVLSSGTHFTVSSSATFDQWYRDVQDVVAIPVTLTLNRVSTSPLKYEMVNSPFFPIDGQGWGNEGQSHNCQFTTEIALQFVHQAGLSFQMTSDDDTWVFINDKQVIDLGGVHSAQSAGVLLDSLSLVAGQTYDLRVFHAERGPGCGGSVLSFSWQGDALLNQPPTADAGGPYTVLEGEAVAVAGSGSDPQGDTPTFAWDLDNDGSFETAGQTAMFSAPLVAGTETRTIALRACDSQNACAVDTADVAVQNTAPTGVSADGPYTVDEGAAVTLTASCTGCDTFEWDLDGTGPFETPGQAVTFNAPLVGATETTTVTVQACDSDDCVTAVAQITIRDLVGDTTPPDISALTASPGTLWPPNHQMVAVTVVPTVSDAVDPSVACRITGVSSNEPINGLGDGDTAPDWAITGPLTLQLRAERSGRGNGRVYTLTVACSDDAGNTATETTAVTVPRSQGRR